MMRVCKDDLRHQHLPVDKSDGKVFEVSCRVPLFILVVFSLLLAKSATAQNGTFALSSAPGGLAFVVGGGGNTLSSQFGTMNALGIGSPATGVTVIPLSNGALYFTQYRITVTGLPNPHTAGVTAFVNSNFNHPLALVMQSCPSNAACTSSGAYSAIST